VKLVNFETEIITAVLQRVQNFTPPTLAPPLTVIPSEFHDIYCEKTRKMELRQGEKEDYQ